MTDKELLELVAKAAGIPYERDSYGIIWTRDPWFPLTDDGDALRLAVKLSIEYRKIEMPHNVGVQAYNGTIQAVFESCGDDPYKATRRAIVRSAAEIGKAMK